MATSPVVNQGKTAFVKEYLKGHRDANLEAVKKAWTAEGKEGTVSESLVSKIRRDLGLTGKKGASGVETSVPAVKGKAKPSPKASKGKVATKAEEAPSPTKAVGKTEFVREQLRRDANLSVKAIVQAWTVAGNKGSISDNLVYKTRADLGIKGKRPSLKGVETDVAPPELSKGSNAVTSAGAVEPSAPQPDGRQAPHLFTPPTGLSSDGERGRVLVEVEREIDELIYRIRNLGGLPDVQEALRAARRLLVRSHEG
jgi:hypothetical protein